MPRGKKKTTKKKTSKKAGKSLATRKAGELATPGSVEERLAQMAAEQAGTEVSTGGSYIKQKDDGFEIGGEKIDNPFEASVLDFRFENAYRVGKYVEGEAHPPACFAIGKVEADLVPHPSSPDKQADRCADCWANEWESDPDGGKGKACKNRRRLAVLPIPEKGDLRDVEPALMGVAPTSLTNWKGFYSKVTNVLKKALLSVICEIERADKVTDFTYVDNLEGDDLAACLEHYDSVQAGLDAPFDVSGYNPDAASKKGKRIKVKNKKAASKARGKKTAKKGRRRA